MKWRFAGTFLATFAVLTLIWAVTDFGDIYRVIVLTLAQAVSPLLHGWFLEFDTPTLRAAAAFKRGTESLPMPLRLGDISMGLMPLVSLIVATPGQTWRRAAIASVIGCLLFCFIDAFVVADLPDNVSAAALALAVNQGGGAATSTVVLMTAAEVDEAVKKSVAYRPPGG